MDINSTLSLLTLGVLVTIAVVTDICTRRIPNVLIGVGVASGLLFQVVALLSGGSFVSSIGVPSLSAALLGGLTGLGLFLPFYVLRTLGAGDVKLLAMIGVFLGPQHTVYAALWAMAAGGVLGLTWALSTGVLRQVFSNLHSMFTTSLINAQTGGGIKVEAPMKTTGRLPYAIAIACGTVFELARTLM